MSACTKQSTNHVCFHENQFGLSDHVLSAIVALDTAAPTHPSMLNANAGHHIGIPQICACLTLGKTCEWMHE